MIPDGSEDWEYPGGYVFDQSWWYEDGTANKYTIEDWYEWGTGEGR